VKKYDILFYNRFANQYQEFRVIAKNGFRAGRLFYKLHDWKLYFECIQHITEVKERHYWTEEEILKAVSLKQ
jgi:hypothetical protein